MSSTPAPETKKEIPKLKRAVFQVASGGSAGFVEVCIMQPLDVVKTRMQLQNKKSGGVVYKGVLDAFIHMYKQEGLLSFWKGIIPPVLAETPKRAVKFVSFEQLKPLYRFGSTTDTPLTFTLAGLSAGIIEAAVVNPFEVVKVAQQADKSIMAEAPSSWKVTNDIIKTHGFGSRGLYKGVTATMSRNGVWNCAYFGFYHSVKNYIPVYESDHINLLLKLLLGFSAGTLGCFFNTPFDVAKSRIQGPQPEAGVIKYKSTLASVSTVYKEEGFLALYKGFVPKVMRLGPGGAIMLIVFEHVYEYLQKNYS